MTFQARQLGICISSRWSGFRISNSNLLTKKRRPEKKEIFRITREILSFVGGKPRKVKEIKISETMRPEAFSLKETSDCGRNLRGE